MAQNGVSTWFDVELDAGCSPFPFADGVRCVPDSVQDLGSPAYADPVCTVPLLQLPTPTSQACPQTTPTAVVVSGECAPTFTTFVVGTPETLSTIYEATQTGCAQEVPSPGTTYATALPASDDVWGLLTTVTQ